MLQFDLPEPSRPLLFTHFLQKNKAGMDKPDTASAFAKAQRQNQTVEGVMGRLLWVALTVVIAVMLVAVIWGRESLDIFLGILGILAWLLSMEYTATVDRVSRWLSQHSPRSWYSRLAATLKRIAPAFAYSDLSLVLASLLLLGVAASNSFIAAVQDLVAKGFLSFDPQLAGFIHLQLYIIGYIMTPPLLVACAAYGFYRGVRDGRASFAKLLVAIPVGVFTASLLLSLIRGGFTGAESLEIITRRTSGSLPSGAEPTSPIMLVSMGLMLWLGGAALPWVFSLLGRLVKRFLLRPVVEPQVSSATGRSAV